MRMRGGLGGLGRAESCKLLIKVWPLFFYYNITELFMHMIKFIKEKRAKTTYSTWKIMIRILSVLGIGGGLV